MVTAVVTAGAVALSSAAVAAAEPTTAVGHQVPDECTNYVAEDGGDSADSGDSGDGGQSLGSASGSSGEENQAAEETGTALECQVPSSSMGRSFPVIIRPALSQENPRVALFLDGADSGEVNGWVEKAGALGHLGEVDKTLVFPVTDPWTWSQDWDGGAEVADSQFETFLASELPDYLATAFGVPDGGRGTTGVVGLSAGAYGTLNLATKYPEQYSSVYALSGIYDPQSVGGRFAIDVTSTYLSGRERAPWSSEESRARNNPTLNLRNLTMPAIVNVSTGVAHPEELEGESPSAAFFLGGPVETGTFVMTAKLHAEARRLGMDNIEFRYDILGGHSWPTWRRAAFDQGTIWTFLDRI